MVDFIFSCKTLICYIQNQMASFDFCDTAPSGRMLLFVNSNTSTARNCWTTYQLLGRLSQ